MAHMFVDKFRSLVPLYLDDPWTAEEGYTESELRSLLSESELPGSITLPQVLQEFYLNLGRCEEIMEAFHFIFDPDELVVEQGYLIFLEDEEERWVWGIDTTELSAPDPLIHRRNNDKDRWTPESATVSEFLFDLLEFSFSEDEPESTEIHTWS